MRSIALSALLFLAACGTATPVGTGATGTPVNPTQRVTTIAALTGDITAGGPLYDRDCAACHAADGTGSTGPAVSNSSTAIDVQIDAIVNGRRAMPAYPSLSDQEIADIVAFYSSL